MAMPLKPVSQPPQSLVPADRDPLARVAAATCDLLADIAGVRHCGFVALATSELVGASTQLLDQGDAMPDRLQEAVAEAIRLRAEGRTRPARSRSGKPRSGDAPAHIHAADGSGIADRNGGVAVREGVSRTAGTGTGTLPLSPAPITFADWQGDGDLAIAALEPGFAVVFAPLHGPTSDLTRAVQAAARALPSIRRIADLRAERVRLVQSERLLQHVAELAHVGGWEQQAAGGIAWSDAVFVMHGLEPGGQMTLERLLALYPSPAREKLAFEIERAGVEGGGFDVTAPIRTPSGEERIVRTVARSVTGSVLGGVSGSVPGSGAAAKAGALYGITQDVTAQLSAERRMWWAANHDPVTSLPNRLLFEDRIAMTVQRARRESRAFALVMVEVSDLARRAERSGYAVPDKHMQDVAARLDTVMRGSDTVARVSFGEFALLFSDVRDEASLAAPMDRLVEQLRQMQANEPAAGILMNAGVAFYPDHATGHEELTRASEMALAKAKRTQRGSIVVFDRQIASDVAQYRETILERARASLAKGEFVPFYQPQIDIETGELVGVEALVRWQTDDVMLDARDFTYVLEDHLIGGEVGCAVLDHVIADLSRLRQTTTLPFRVSINASRTEVLRNDFLDTFLDKTRAGNLAPEDFIIEITEDVIVGVDDQLLHDKVSFLASSGVEFALDDFGTGYASLIHITSFPINEIKIDKQFVFGIESDGRKRAIVRGIIDIARSMGLHVIAEGVETQEQLDILRAVGCRYAQGYFYSVPLPFADFAELVRGGQRPRLPEVAVRGHKGVPG